METMAFEILISFKCEVFIIKEFVSARTHFVNQEKSRNKHNLAINMISFSTEYLFGLLQKSPGIYCNFTSK